MRTCVCLGRHFANDTIDKVRQAAGRLRGDARGRDGGGRQELAAGVGVMTSHDEMPTRFPALVWAVIFTILLVAAVAIFALVLIR
jgi:hypothetical protein